MWQDAAEDALAVWVRWMDVIDGYMVASGSSDVATVIHTRIHMWVSFSVFEITSDFTGLNLRRSSPPPRRPQRPSSSWDLKQVEDGPQPAAEPTGRRVS